MTKFQLSTNHRTEQLKVQCCDSIQMSHWFSSQWLAFLSIIFLSLTNNSKLSVNVPSELGERNVDGRNFIVLSYTRLPVLTKKLRWSQLKENPPICKVLFIFHCSKNWQKKSAGNHLLQMIACTLFLPIFTAAKDEKYFRSNLPLHWYIYLATSFIPITIDILLTGSNSRLRNYESWISTNFINNHVVFDEKQ